AWPDGTTSYYPHSTLGHTGAGVSGRLAVLAEIGLRTPGGSSPVLFQVEPDADGRDILDAGVDVLITSSPAAIQYSRTQPGRVAIPLPWARSYLLVLPARSASTSGMGCDAADLRPLREALAQAVHVAARGAAGPCWWHSDSSDAAASGRSGTGSRQILYPIHDATARELAERIVALAAPGRDEPATAALHRVAPEIFGTGGWSAAGADSARFAERLARASDAAYILSIPHDPAWAAAARATLLSRAPWLAPLDRTQALVPLVDTRETLLIRRDRGIPRMTILHDGTVILDPLTNAPARARTSERTSERTSAHTSTSANASVNRAP
ncbi:MAG TPA: hypothetical protein VFK39_01910, partial [Gemmatimonadaceae bacterium]|nr:hypothetical protein [Gemmatimonadaceae bacterium]